MKTARELAMELCSKLGLSGSEWEREKWLAIYVAARTSALEEAAKVADEYAAHCDHMKADGWQGNWDGHAATAGMIATKVRALARKDGGTNG